MISYCNRRLYKGNSYEICLPITDTGVTSVRFYTSGDIVIEKEGKIVDDTMCFELTKTELDLLPDGVLRYSYADFDSNTRYVIVTPADYSGSTLEDIIADAFESGHTAGYDDGLSACTGGNADLVANIQGDYFFIPEGTTRIRNHAFEYTSLSSITIPSSVTEIDDYAFDSTRLTGITIPSSVDAIGKSTFAHTKLQEINLPDSVTYLGQSAFYGCESLTAATLSSGLTSIPHQLFELCPLTGITLPTGITSIGLYAFRRTSLTGNIVIPSGVTLIWQDAFGGCSGLTSMTFESPVPATITASGQFNDASLGDASYTWPIYVPCEAVEDYKTAWPYYAHRIACQQEPKQEATTNT